jgi:S1-C subfamily serine protease
MRTSISRSVLFIALLLAPRCVSSDELKCVFPNYSVGIILDAATHSPIGSGFVFENTRYVITARHVLIDDSTGKLVKVLFEPIKGIGAVHGEAPYQLPLKVHRLLTNEDIAILEVEGENPCKQALTRGDSERLRVGDLVGYGGFDHRVQNVEGFSISATRIRMIKVENGLRRFQLEGMATFGFSGGPLFGGGTTVVGVILRGKPSPDGKSSIFYAISAEHIPSLPDAPTGKTPSK